MRVPTHADGSALFWEFATDNYDVAFGLFFEWVDHDNETEISVHISDSEDEDLEDDDDEDAVTGMYSSGFEDQEGPEWGRFDVYEAQRYSRLIFWTYEKNSSPKNSKLKQNP